ncbi:hypothetical protein C8D87_105604 [Lentzea atacamensis]|uniref:PH domain-containing protein n=1 Tax=Lentzea atacamensis TaxID=531938 RepID=A0ABX9E6W2_9PSEU|nr:hypothetical protein [Lentzea atacamensis]RAS65109.1 hypothetical protein C8D87_105604 [Lentzea atacamensis]
MSSPWRFVLLLLALVFMLVGFVMIAGAIADREAVVSSVVTGTPALVLGGFGACRSLIMGVRYSPDGIELRRLECTRHFSWGDVEAVDTRLTPGDILVFLGQADIVLLLKSGDEEWLSPLAVYSFRSIVPKRVEAKADALRAALDLHRPRVDRPGDAGNTA